MAFVRHACLYRTSVGQNHVSYVMSQSAKVYFISKTKLSEKKIIAPSLFATTNCPKAQ